MSWKPKTGDLVAFKYEGEYDIGLLYYLSDEDWYVDWGDAYPRSFAPRAVALRDRAAFDYITLESWRNQYEKLLQEERIVV